MDDLKLKEIDVRLEYAVLGEDEPYEEAATIVCEELEVVDEQPDGNLRAKILVALERSNNNYVLYRRRVEKLTFSFDNNSSLEVLRSALKIILTLEDDEGNILVDTAYYPVEPEDDTPFSDPNELVGIDFKFFVAGKDEAASPPYRLFHVNPGGAGLEPPCTACFPPASVSKRTTCALNGCYS
jgi:hypothetical protein